jgi:phosphoadenosine phosphosulfate reductase
MDLESKVKELAKGIEAWKVKTSLEVLDRAFQRFAKVGVAWSTGKDSTVNLFLTRQFDQDLPVLFGDTTVHFKETYEHRDRIAAAWGLNLVNMTPDVAYDAVKGARERCCHQLKTRPALRAFEALGLDAVVVGVRWDEHPARANERYVAERADAEGMDAEWYQHARVHPILHWTEADIWGFTRAHGLPHNPLYDRGFRSVGCAPCTQPAPPDAPERSGRAQDKEEIMGRLRALGYW